MKEHLNKNNFIPIATKIHNGKYDYSKSVYVKAKEKVIITCPIHGDFEQRPQDHVLKACGCPKCKGDVTKETHSYTKEKFLELAQNKHKSKYNYSKMEYINYSTPIKIICPEHGEFWQTPANHLYGQGCPKCRLVGQTRLYNRLKQQFPQLEIIFEASKDIVSWIGNQRIDIYIPSINYAIELNGPQHYEEIPYFKDGSSLKVTQERDALKRKKCEDNGCKLIELKYHYTNNEFQMLVNEVTQKLEELEKKYYSEESSQKEKDEYALEAGKLITEEILHNTQDNAGLL